MHCRPVWAEIDLGAIGHNVRELRRVTQPRARLMAIVKANAYGHGAVEVARVALANGAERLGVALLQEAIELRRAAFGVPILILGYTPPDGALDVVKYNLTQTVFDYQGAEALSWAAVQLRKTAKIHLKLDTGMGRLGFVTTNPRSLEEILRIARLPGLEIEGIYTHFASSDSKDKTSALRQLELFRNFVDQLEKLGLEIPLKHTANSGAILDMPSAHLDLVRAGIALYGLYPSDEVKKEKVALRPAMTLKARIAYVKEVGPGSGISYGSTYVTSGWERIATIPLGYADGYNRRLSNRAEVLIKGQRCPVVGRVCMDQFMVRVSHLEQVTAGEEVVLFGRQGQAELPVDELASLLDTINYELVCAVSSRVPRIYV
ncbi:MAG: alanine racemase [Bacillota bacterium]